MTSVLLETLMGVTEVGFGAKSRRERTPKATFFITSQEGNYTLKARFPYAPLTQ